MRFPRFSAFTIFGQKWVVKRSNQVGGDDDVQGYCDSAGSILLKTGLRGNEADLTYAHELVHALLFSMGKSKLSANEEFVELLGRAIYEWITTGVK